MLTQKRLKELLSYNEETGVFTNKTTRGNRVYKGGVAGSVTPDGYCAVYLEGKTYRAHRLVWLYVHGKFPTEGLDHINHIKDDNRLVNLRPVTQKENCKNRLLHKANTSKVTGVYLKKSSDKWVGYITVDYQTINLGAFKDKFEAICARKSAEVKYNFHPNHGSKRKYQVNSN